MIFLAIKSSFWNHKRQEKRYRNENFSNTGSEMNIQDPPCCYESKFSLYRLLKNYIKKNSLKLLDWMKSYSKFPWADLEPGPELVESRIRIRNIKRFVASGTCGPDIM
jgi:hypothetical protein